MFSMCGAEMIHLESCLKTNMFFSAKKVKKGVDFLETLRYNSEAVCDLLL